MRENKPDLKRKVIAVILLGLTIVGGSVSAAGAANAIAGEPGKPGTYSP
jgi:hypothetical protein